MTEFEKWAIGIAIAGASSTLLAVIVALFGEKIRQLWSSPKLRIKLAEPVLTKTNAGQKGWYYLLQVRNERRSCPAPNVRVLLTKVQKKAPDDSWIDQRFSGPVQVMWRWPNRMPLFLTVGFEVKATFACVHTGQQVVELRMYWYPNNLQPKIMPNDPARYTFKAVSDVAESEEITVEVAWDGTWAEGRAEMAEHLIVKTCGVEGARARPTLDT